MDKNEKYTELLKEQIATLKKENRFLEFKSNYQDYNRLGKYISALSNGACLDHQDFGYLYFGVEDETLQVKGTTFDISKQKAEGNQSLEIYLRRMVSPKITFKIEEFLFEGNLRIVVFVIPAAVKEPTCYMNKPYIRIDSHVTELTPYTDWMREIYMTDIDWSAQVIEDATFDSLDPQAIKEARRGYKQRFPEHAEESETWSDEVFLNRAKLTLDGQITRTTLLLVGKEESAHYLNHIAQIVWKCFQDGKVFGDIFTIPFLLSTTEILHKIRNYRFKIYPRNSLIPNEVWKYDNETILECMHNCIAHQNYTSNARIIVTEDADKLTFENVGNFYEGSYEDYILGEKTPKHYRNPFLAQAMVNVKMIDTQGYGIHTMYEKQRERYLPMPDYDESSPEKVVLKLHGSIIDENYSQILMERKDLTLSETVLLDRVQKHKTISSEAIDLLREKNLVEGRKPNVYVSKHIAKATGKEVEYIQEKGFSDRNYREMILDALKEHKELSKEKLNALMLPVFPKSLSEEQKKRKLTNMLHYLRSKGAISYDNRKKVWRYETSSF
jgi:ATP-dependent DNA helicase RecG